MKRFFPLLLLVVGLIVGYFMGAGGLAGLTAPPDPAPPRAPAPPPSSSPPSSSPAAGPPVEIHTFHAPWGLPVGAPPSNDLIVRTAYALSANDETKFADWVAFRVDAASVAGDEPTSRTWRSDPWLADDETLEPADYKGAYAALDVDRGHQAPLAALRGTGAWEETNFLSNITPQKSALNQGPWRILETRVRDLTADYDAAYVLTGPLYERAMPALPGADEPHRVPSGYWQVVVVGEAPGALRGAAFVLDQDTPRDADVAGFATTIDEVERRSGLDLLPLLPDDAEAALEGTLDAGWVRAHFGP